MKNIINLLLFLPLPLLAQKNVDLDKFRFSVQYRSLPAIKIDTDYRTYNVEIETTRLMNPLLAEMQPENSVRIEGWKKLPQDGHLTVKVNIGDLVPGDVTVKERVVTTKNGNGVITGTRIYYYQEVAYTFEAEAIIQDYKGMHIMDEQLAARNYKRVYRSPEFASRVIASGYFIANSIAITKELFRESVTAAIHRLSERLNQSFGYEPVTVNDMMWVIDSRKHPEYDDWRKAIRQINDVLFEMNAATPITDARDKLQPAIAYFEKIKKLYASNNRHDRKLRYGCYYNLAVLYYYLDDPQAMMKEANGLELNDFDARDAKGFKETATWLKNIFEQNNIYSRHFAIDTESFKGPMEKADVSVK
ncbi:MAG TPA: hypothetical protein VFV31_07060 [Chitinophagaceae bacterium]|nr:hypothetical protein [Chitinophagaceae bacterium]